MSEIQKKLGFSFESPYLIAKEEKAKGRKVFGITPMYFPHELVHASGALPVILQASHEPVTLGYHHYFHFFCGFTRGIVDYAIKGKFDFLDAFILSDICFELRHMGDPLKIISTFPIIYIQWPLESNENRWMDFILKRLRKCKLSIEKIVGNKITDNEITKSIILYNQNRSLLRKIYEIRKSRPWILSARDMTAIVITSMVWPVERCNPLLREVISYLENIEYTEDNRKKLLLSGHLCHEVKQSILDVIENEGGVVVGDDLYTGFRYYSDDIYVNDPPLETFARHYLNLGVPCPTRFDANRDWADYLIDQAADHNADGIVILLAKNCEPHMIYYPYLKSKFEDAGIKHILLQVEHEMVSIEGIRSRVQAFIETLEMGVF